MWVGEVLENNRERQLGDTQKRGFYCNQSHQFAFLQYISGFHACLFSVNLFYVNQYVRISLSNREE